jgi:TATA-box binding protein (TBP) (component of TFIID and TFIIIB)
MLIFNSGKFRIMGGKIDDLEAHANIFDVARLCARHIPKIKLQTMTSTFKFPNRINLALLADNIESYCNLEQFPAVHVHKFKPMCVNVFASGKAIITGLQDEEVANDIETELLTLYSSLIII